ncbi:hypothetical protein HMPREF1870_00003 [Bacteroidales bacterium KA00344]|nr:hypothetical protein HMPREF1870_00003 [Bacteroidales bacterium KA00344]
MIFPRNIFWADKTVGNKHSIATMNNLFIIFYVAFQIIGKYL